MLSKIDFIRISLETNLFFGRIMKEHLIFMEAGFLPINNNLILEADQLKRSFEEILEETLALSNGIISKEILNSNEIVTKYTLEAETITESLTGISIDKEITLKELNLISEPNYNCPSNLENLVFDLNQRTINLVKEVIQFKEMVLALLLSCNIFAALYPLLIEHILREAHLYLRNLMDLQKNMKPEDGILEQEIFWDTIMGEHALFIRGLLDPSEKDLFNTANKFGKIFEELVEITKKASKKDIPIITKETLKTTMEIQKFKTAGTEGLIACKIKSIMTPLLGDHVLREANHYIRLLESFKKSC
ncbi:MAG: DUF2935 domain-containing protein [Tissierellia bacterium]|nr:DUF2935 domain-containing protein [Tissierellia bacterium]